MYRHLAFLGPESIRAAEATECAGEQGRFWEYLDALFEPEVRKNTGAFSDPNLVRFARAVDLDSGEFLTCLQSERYAGQVERDRDSAMELGVDSTPTVFVNGRLLDGLRDYESYRRAIEGALSEVQ